MDTKERVILDTDFMNYLTRAKGDIDYYFNKIISDLKVEPVVHEFLYNKEMMANPLVRKLVEAKRIVVMKYEDYLDDINDSYYEKLFCDLYKYCNGRELKLGKNNFRTYQESEANLGEIHSVILALYTGYTLFFSNDNGAKKMVKVKVNTDQYKLNVMNIMDVYMKISNMKEKTTTKKDFEMLTKGDKSRKAIINEIRNKWID